MKTSGAKTLKKSVLREIPAEAVTRVSEDEVRMR